MGGTSHSKYDQSFDSKEWQELDHPKDNDWECMIVRNRKTGQLLDRYQVQCSNQKQYEKYMVSVHFRRNQDNIVRIIHYQPKIIKQFCGSSYTLYVYLQHCKSRFSQFQDIPSPDYLYCALAMLNGFQKLFKKIGRFQIQSHQVMIDQMGKIRVWLNSDFSSNQAQDIKSMDTPNSLKNQQYLMVNDILTLIFQSLDQSDENYQIKFKNFYSQKKIIYNDKIGFFQAKNIIYDFVRINKIEIPNIFTQVLNIYQQEKLEQIKNQEPNKDVKCNEVNRDSKNRVVEENGHGGVIMINNNPENIGVLPINYPNQMNSASFIRGTSMPIIIRPGITNTVPGTPIYINNRNTMPTTQAYPTTSSYSGYRVATPLSPLQIIPPPSPTQNITHSSPLTNIIFQNPTHSYLPKSQNITINPRLASPQSIQPILTINQSQIKPIQTYPIQPLPSSSSSFNQGKTILHSSYPLQTHHQGIRKTQSLQWNIEQQQQRKLKKKKKTQLGQQQLQIQKNFILADNKDNTIHNLNQQNINQANVIRQLSQLHKIQQIEKSKRGGEKSSQDNQQQNHKQQQQQLEDNLFLDNNIPINHFHPKEKIYQSIGNTMRANNTYYQRQPKIIFSSGHYPQPQFIQQSFSPIQSKQSPRPVTSQYYNGFSPPQLNRQPSPPPFQIKTNINNNVQILPNNNVNLTRSTLKKQVYYTVSDQIQLDPEIVNDLSLYVPS